MSPRYIGEFLRRGTQYVSYIYGSGGERRGALYKTMVAQVYRSVF